MGLWFLLVVVVFLGIHPTGIMALLGGVSMGAQMWAGIPYIVTILICGMVITMASVIWRAAVFLGDKVVLLWQWRPARSKPVKGSQPPVLTQRVEGQDPHALVRQWIEECCYVDRTRGMIEVHRAEDSYRKWAQEKGLPVPDFAGGWLVSVLRAIDGITVRPGEKQKHRKFICGIKLRVKE